MSHPERSVITTVTPNPCIDDEKHFAANSLVTGTNRAYQSEKYPGGKGIDVSRAIHAVGGNSIATGFIGGNLGTLLRGMLAIEGIVCDFVEIGGETRTNVICNMANTNEIRINDLGPRITGGEFNELLRKILGFKAVAGVVCGSVCRGMEPVHSLDRILASFKEANPQCLTFLDTGEHHTIAALGSLFPPDYIKPNIYEFHRLLRLKVSVQGIAPRGHNPHDVGEEALIKAYCSPREHLGASWKVLIDRLRDFSLAYPTVHVLLSMSRLGIVTFVNDHCVHAYYSGQIEKRTTVGAGDAFLGGFVASFVVDEPRNLQAALCAGVAASTARLQGNHREFGYIDHERLQEVRASRNLHVKSFELADTELYVAKTLGRSFRKGGRA